MVEDDEDDEEEEPIAADDQMDDRAPSSDEEGEDLLENAEACVPHTLHAVAAARARLRASEERAPFAVPYARAAAPSLMFWLPCHTPCVAGRRAQRLRAY